MKRRLVILAVVTLCTVGPSVAFALGLQPIVPSDCNGSGGCSSICDIALAAQNALDDGIFIAIFLSAILFAWAGWQMIIGSSSGDTEKVKGAKKIFMYVTGGLVLIISAWLIVSVIMSALTNNANWNAICSTSTS
jgi:Type IV secretion system pilin